MIYNSLPLLTQAHSGDHFWMEVVRWCVWVELEGVRTVGTVFDEILTSIYLKIAFIFGLHRISAYEGFKISSQVRGCYLQKISQFLTPFRICYRFPELTCACDLSSESADSWPPSASAATLPWLKIGGLLAQPHCFLVHTHTRRHTCIYTNTKKH